MTRKKSFNAPSPVFVIFDTETKHPEMIFGSRKDLDYAIEDYPLNTTETVVEYYLPTKRTPKSKEK